MFASTSGYRLGITTKSDLVARDIDLLCDVARRHYVTIAMTITTVDRELARLLEPEAEGWRVRRARTRRPRRGTR